MFGMKRRAAERSKRRAEEWKSLNGPMAVHAYYVDDETIEASGYDLDEGSLIFWTGKRYWFPSISGIGFSGTHKTTVRIVAAGTWKNVTVEYTKATGAPQ